MLASLAGLSLLAACSETSNPTALRSAGAAAFTVGPTANPAGATVIPFVSNATTQYCSSITALYSYSVPATRPAVAGCGAAFDLEPAIAVYNPGWAQGLNGGHWIGPNALSNEYRTNPGSYYFQTQFTIPSGATTFALNDTLMSDNAIAVFLNGFPVEAQVISDCVGSPCNWVHQYIISDANAAHFNANGVVNGNTLTVQLVDTPDGGTPGNSYACITAPQISGTAGYGGATVLTANGHIKANWTATMTATSGCENPGGVVFWGTVAYATPVSTTWCSPGFWKNAGKNLWSAYWNVKYSTLVGAAPLKAGSPSNPSLLDVVSNPSIYGGAATNSVADFISNKAFGTPIGSGVESCPNPDATNFPGLTT
jgi:hypothetical protein